MGVYKIKDLENLTGIKAHTIRIWEKRYGILKPTRTETQIRNYNDQEVVTILGISMLNKRGFKISRIAEMSAIEFRKQIQEIASNSIEDTVYENLLISLLELDEKMFQDTINNLIASVGVEKVFVKYLIHFLEKIGMMWLIGTINPAHEHFISNLIRQKLIAEIDRLPAASKKEKVLLFLPEHESHELGLLFYNYLLKKKGLTTYYLGQSLPFQSLLSCIEQIKPDYLVSSWIVSVEENFMEKYFINLRKTTKIPTYVGGIQVVLNQKRLENLIIPINNSNDLNISI